jgi:hypothetical protein
MIGCLTGTRAVETNHGLKKITVEYNKSLVTKAIHIFRHPLDNIVARFHLDYQVQRDAGDNDVSYMLFLLAPLLVLGSVLFLQLSLT